MATYVRKLQDTSGNTIIPATRADAVYIGEKKLSDMINENGLTTSGVLSAYPVGCIVIGSYAHDSVTPMSWSPAAKVGGSWNSISTWMWNTMSGSTYRYYNNITFYQRTACIHAAPYHELTCHKEVA